MNAVHYLYSMFDFLLFYPFKSCLPSETFFLMVLLNYMSHLQFTKSVVVAVYVYLNVLNNEENLQQTIKTFDIIDVLQGVIEKGI